MVIEEMSYDICLKAHPYWLSTLRQFALPVHLMEKLPDSYKKFIQAGLAYKKQGQLEAAQQRFQQAQLSVNSNEDQGFGLHLQALALLTTGKVGESQTLMQHCVALAPDCAQYHYNLGISYLLSRATGEDIAKAVTRFKQALEAQPSLIQAHTALALIYTLARQWQEAERMARQAISLNPQAGNRLVDLCLMNATYEQGLPIEGAFDFASVTVDATTQIDDALHFLPSVELSQLQLAQSELPILLIVCDPNYLVKHAVPLIWSLVEVQCQYPIHLHLFNPDSHSNQIVKMLQTKMAPIPLSISFESVEVTQYSSPSIYYSSVRFCRLYQLSLANPKTNFIMVDADVLFRNHPAKLALWDKKGDMGFTYAEYEPMWDKIAAGFIYSKATLMTSSVLSQIAVFIIDNLRKQTARWFVDQVALFVTYQKFKSTLHVQFLPAQQCLNQDFDDDAIIWAIVNEQKQQQNKYNEYKHYLLTKYGMLKRV